MSEELELTLDQMLEAAKPAQTSVPICLRIDVAAEIEELERKIAESTNSDDDLRMVDRGDDPEEMALRIRILEKEAAKHTISLRLQALDRYEWNKAVDRNKTEDEETGGKKLDLNKLAEDIFPQSLVSPEMTPGQREKFLAKITEGQWETILRALWDLNRQVTTVGKSLTASMALATKSGKPGSGEQ